MAIKSSLVTAGGEWVGVQISSKAMPFTCQRKVFRKAGDSQIKTLWLWVAGEEFPDLLGGWEQ